MCDKGRHGKLILQEGPMHAKDDPPQYRCEICNEFLEVTVSPVVIGVRFGSVAHAAPGAKEPKAKV